MVANFVGYEEDGRDQETVVDLSKATPPASLAVEEAVLNCIFLDEDAIQAVVEMIGDNFRVFYSGQNSLIYQAAYSLYQANCPTDYLSVRDWLEERNKLQGAGGDAKLEAICSLADVSANLVEGYCQRLLKKFTRRNVLRAADKIRALAHNPDLSEEDVLDQAQQAILDVPVLGEAQNIPHIRDAMARIESNPEMYTFDTPNGPITQSGIPTGLYDLDAMVQGLKPGELITLAARPGMGKTAFIIRLARFVGIVLGLPVALFSLEMDEEQIIKRFISMDTGIEFSRVFSDRLTEDEEVRQAEALERLTNAPIYLDATPGISSKEISRKIRKKRVEMRKPFALVLVDYLQLIEEPTSGRGEQNRVQELSRITRHFKKTARKERTCFIELSQLSRGVESRQNKRPMMSDLRESGSIEQDSDIIIMLYRDEYYYPDSPDRGLAEVILVKQRNGPTGTVKVIFESRYARFENRSSVQIQQDRQQIEEARSVLQRQAEAPPPAHAANLIESLDGDPVEDFSEGDYVYEEVSIDDADFEDY